MATMPLVSEIKVDARFAPAVVSEVPVPRLNAIPISIVTAVHLLNARVLTRCDLETASHAACRCGLGRHHQ
jgi:hypothetical protein